MLSWRNWLARKTVNLEVGGSSPPGSVVLKYDFYKLKFALVSTLNYLKTPLYFSGKKLVL